MGQKHNFGDAPEPPIVILEFRDRKYSANSNYRIVAFNTLGESLTK